jgi:hypothetical protein
VTARGKPDRLDEIALESGRYAGEAGAASTRHDDAGSEARRRRFERNAVAMLRAAIAAGFRDAGCLRREPALEPVRPLAEFQALAFDLEFPADPFAQP